MPCGQTELQEYTRYFLKVDIQFVTKINIEQKKKFDPSVRKLAIEEGYVTEEEADKLLDPYAMTGKTTEPEAEYATYKKVANLG